jgi:hypothetical protein
LKNRLVTEYCDKEGRVIEKINPFSSGNNPGHSHTAMLQGTSQTTVKAK